MGYANEKNEHYRKPLSLIDRDSFVVSVIWGGRLRCLSLHYEILVKTGGNLSVAEWKRLTGRGKEGGTQVEQLARPNKYNATIVRDNEGKVTAASKREQKRREELIFLEKRGEITGLKFQPRFPFKANKKRGMMRGLVYKSGRVCTYVADFEYYDIAGKRVIEDSKGVRTLLYKMKVAALEAYYGLEVVEV